METYFSISCTELCVMTNTDIVDVHINFKDFGSQRIFRFNL